MLERNQKPMQERVGERILDGEQSPCAPGPAPQVLKLTNRHLRTGAAQLDEEELGS